MNIRLIRYVFWGLSLVFMGGIWYQYQSSLQPTARTHTADGTQMGALQLGGSFKLKNQHGHMVDIAKDKHKVRLVYFGYTFCPDLCPLALTNISQALNMLKNDRDKVAVYFITIDPKRDTQEKLKQYHLNFNPQIHMLHGTEAELEPIFKAYKVFFQKVEDDHLSDYLLDHTTFIYVLDANDAVCDVLPHTTPGEEIFRTINDHLYKRRFANK
ncbi:MAG: SCO family protein [Alphaproteobacteria bacterium]|nr:SCO family protein [Alphaproteobacteria bacterium]